MAYWSAVAQFQPTDAMCLFFGVCGVVLNPGLRHNAGCLVVVMMMN